MLEALADFCLDLVTRIQELLDLYVQNYPKFPPLLIKKLSTHNSVIYTRTCLFYMANFRIVRSEWIIWLCRPRVWTWQKLHFRMTWVITTNSDQVVWKVGPNWKVDKFYLMWPQYVSSYGHKLNLAVLRKLQVGQSIDGNSYLLMNHRSSRNR